MDFNEAISVVLLVLGCVKRKTCSWLLLSSILGLKGPV